MKDCIWAMQVRERRLTNPKKWTRWRFDLLCANLADAQDNCAESAALWADKQYRPRQYVEVGS